MSVRLKEIMFDAEPIGLADEFAAVSQEILAELETEEGSSAGSAIYFGMPLSIEEIAEIKAEVLKSEASESGFVLTVKVLELDARLKSIAEKELTASGGAGEEKSGGPMWARGLRQMNGAYAILVNSPAGVLTAEQLARITEVAKANAGIVKLTHAQRVVVLTSAENIESAEKALAATGLRVGVLHHGIRNIRACCGALCKWAKKLDAIPAAIELDKKIFGKGTHFDIKIAISDCVRNCSESYCADIGTIGGDGDYKIVIGGRGAQIPFRAINFASGIKPELLTDAVEKILDWYAANASTGERLWKTIERVGTPLVESKDFSAITSALAGISDGVDEESRTKSHFARLAGAAAVRRELGFSL